MADKRCRYCGIKNPYMGGSKCPGNSPSGGHEITFSTEDICIYCGVKKPYMPGGSCSKSPTKKHVLPG